MIIAVYGDKRFADREALEVVLDDVLAREKDPASKSVIVGSGDRGVVPLARRWAAGRGVIFIGFPTDDPTMMLVRAKPDVVVTAKPELRDNDYEKFMRLARLSSQIVSEITPDE